jgi:hypothetical protein
MPFLTLSPIVLQIHCFFFIFQTSTLFADYSRNLQEKKSHSEVRTVREILRSFLDEMIAADPKDVGAPSEFWHPGELCPALYPQMDKKRYYADETLTGMFPKEYIEKYWKVDPQKVDPPNSWMLGDHRDSKSLFGWLFKAQPAGFNARWMWPYRKKILEAFLGDDTQYVDLLLYYGKTRFTPRQKRDVREIMMHVFTKRHRNAIYGLQESSYITEQPRTLISYVLLVSDFVFSLGTMKTLHLLLGRDFATHPSFRYTFLCPNPLEKLSPDYTPLHDYPKTDYLYNDARFILEAFLRPQSILGKGLMKLIAKEGMGNARYKNHMYHEKAYLMISAQWLNIVNLLGYQAKPTEYLKKCFPTLVALLTEIGEDTRISNLRELATMLNEFLFGDNSLFKIDPDDLSAWENHCIPNKTEFIGEKENWVKQPWVHFRLKKEDIQDENHPFYSIRLRNLTVTNIVEWLFLGKMWQTDESPANYTKSNPPFYDDDDTCKWAEEAYCPKPYTFRPFDVGELDADEAGELDVGAEEDDLEVEKDEEDERQNDQNDDDYEEEEENVLEEQLVEEQL